MGHVPGRITEQEIFAQPRLWNDTVQGVAVSAPAVRALWQTHSPDQLLLTGCGSSYYLALSAAAILRTLLGINSRALPSSEILFAPDEAVLGGRRTFGVAISRSGETTETVRALEYLRARGVSALTLTCSGGGMLSHAGDLAIDLPVVEQSVVMTGSFTSMLLALALLGADLAGDGALTAALRALPAAAETAIPRLVVDARQHARDGRQAYVFLGSGPLFGIASEGALKMTEMALVPARAYHTLEFLHGPKAAVTRDTTVVGLLSERARPYEGQVLRHLSDLGAEVLAVGNGEAGLTVVDVGAPAGSVPGILLATVWAQALALHVARARGVDPDAPSFLEPVVMWEGSRILTGGR